MDVILDGGSSAEESLLTVVSALRGCTQDSLARFSLTHNHTVMGGVLLVTALACNKHTWITSGSCFILLIPFKPVSAMAG